MNDLARTLAFVAIAISFLIPLAGLVRGYNPQQMLLTWLSLTFLMVPGQPPIIISMALALASLELARKNVIVRHLHGAETLGSVTILASDKTGTMTENKMSLQGILLGNGRQITKEERGGKNGEIWNEFFSQSLPSHLEFSNGPTDLALTSVAKED